MKARLATLAAALLLGAATAQEGPPSDPPGQAAAATAAGHQRMLSLLRRIEQESRSQHRYLGTGTIEELRRRLADLGPDAPPRERLEALLRLGVAEFNLGRAEGAIEPLSAALEGIPEDAVALRSRTLYHLAMAFLRLGERKNCVANHSGESCILPIRGGGVHTAAPQYARQAIGHFGRALATLPEKSVEFVAIRWLANIAYMAVGDYPRAVPREILFDPELLASEEEFPRLRNVAPHLGLDVVDYAGGAVVEDLDGDGRLDILTSSWAPWTPLRLFHNRGDGTFEERSREAGLEGITGGLNLTHADYDNDGDFDVLVLRGAWLGLQGQHPNSLLRNDGRGRFTDVTFDAGLGESHRPTQAAAWADYDNDGDLDLYVGNEGGEDEFPAQLFRNRGDGTFIDVAREAGVENRRFSKAVAWGDFDGDRYPDLYVSNYWHPNRLYRNNGDGTFSDLAPELGLTEPKGAFASWFWDFDNDGALDIYSGGYPYKGDSGLYNLFVVVASYLDIETGAERARLYRGDGRGGFEEVGLEANLGRVTMPMGANYGDLDNDGFLDFYVGTGYPEYDGLIPNLLYRNDAGRRFLDVTTAAGVGHLQKGHGVVFADLDGDGDQDLFEQVGGFYTDDDFANALFENPGPVGNWLEVRLVGVRSNRAAFGARVRAEIVEGEARRSIYRTIGTGGSFGSNPLAEHLGLGEATAVDELEIYWPTSDTTQTFRDVAAGQSIEIVEGAGEYRTLRREPVRLGGS